MNQRQYRSLKRISWDYDISAEELFAVISGDQTHAGHWTQDDILVRMLEKLSWYELLDFFTPDFLSKKLTPSFLEKIRIKEMREKYERLGRILRGEAVSFTKWGAEYREQCKNTLFSNRWYST